jgi:predicted murein hydrolase (TIGR00659 family)
MIMDQIINSPFFGIFLSILGFEIGLLIFKFTKFPLFNPLLLGIFIIIGILQAFKIDYESYNIGASYINYFLGPITVILAVPLYRQINLLKKNLIPILTGITVGSVTSIVAVILLCKIFGMEQVLQASLVPKSVTTPIGVELSKTLEGIPSVTVITIIISGITGAVLGPLTCRIFRIKNPVAVGVAMGTASHALGTSKALELGETQGAMSSLSIGLAGIITVIVAPGIFSLMVQI